MATRARAQPARKPGGSAKAAGTAADSKVISNVSVQPAAQDGRLDDYRRKRRFERTPEPPAEGARPPGWPREEPGRGGVFVVQKHAASQLHYDFRLELAGVLLSWACPKGLSLDPMQRRIAIRTEDHPLPYADFEGEIPKGLYGAGRVIVWDRGTWRADDVDPAAALAAGKLIFTLAGHKLRGRWELVRIAKPGDRSEAWILFKKRGDAHARSHAEHDVLLAEPDSVLARPWPAAEAAPSADAAPAPTRPAAAVLAAAPQAPLADRIEPQLATAAASLPSVGRWGFEIKFDGYRLMARLDGAGGARLITRNGHDWTARMPALAAAFGPLARKAAWIDGEIVVLGADGLPDFSALQNAFDRQRDAGIVFYAFDLLQFDGRDLRGLPLVERQAVLVDWIGGAADPALRVSARFEAGLEAMLASAERMGLEGVMAKRLDAPYVSGRSATWLKLKVRARQEFVVVAFSERSDGSPQVGSLLLAAHGADGRLQVVGGVGTGWSAAQAEALRRRLEPLRVAEPAPGLVVAAATRNRWRRTPGVEHWVRPEVVVEVAFAGFTADGNVRHATWLGGRDDKPAADVRLDREKAVVARPEPGGNAGASASISHGERVIDRSTGLTKADLVRYTEAIAPWLFEQVRERPVSLLRAPEGVAGTQFFQKHDEKSSMPGLRRLDPSHWPDHEALLVVPAPGGLGAAARMNVIEWHTWGARLPRLAQPDRIIFDLDPGEGVAFAQVQEGALLVRTLLEGLGLRCWLKTSGGKGLHVVVPVAPKAGWASVARFAQAAVAHLARTIPARFVAKSGPANRVGKIFVDHLRNRAGATTVAAYSARARPGLGVSMPVDWEELPQLRGGDHWTIANARDHVSLRPSDPWADLPRSRQTLTKAWRTLGLEGAPQPPADATLSADEGADGTEGDGA